MKIKICTTDDFSSKEWNSYQNSFNAVFETNRDLEYFKHKYKKSIEGFSYHAILLDNNLDVVGACSVIPMMYNKNEHIIKIGQAVDVFILKNFRKDPLMLSKMYSNLKDLLIANSIIAVMAVPNSIAFPYWINIVKWKYLGNLKYWIIPIKLGSIMNKSNLYNLISSICIKFLLVINNLLSLIYNKVERKSTYELIDDEKFIDYRFSKGYEKINLKNITFYFRIYDEDNVKTAYLLDAKQKNRLSYRALVIATSYIVKNTNSDLILYVGPIKFPQLMFFRVPNKYQPKQLPLTCDILEKSNEDLYSDMLKLGNWNFGLKNYDVR
jgi:hypothetical protein